MSRPRIALVACTEAMDLDTDGPPLFAALEARGVDYDVVAWDDPRAKWKKYRAAVLRASWDYHRRVDEFRDVLESIESVTRLLNPLEVIEWNLDKRYLLELSRAGLPVIPTAHVSHLSPPTELGSALAHISRWGTPEVVVKPTVSASSNDTFRLEAADGSAVSRAVQSIVDSDRVAMVQPYLEQVDSYGERGAVYVSGRFSHGFARSPRLEPGEAPKDVLVSAEEISEVELTSSERSVADRVNDWLTGRFGELLYARVDMLPSESGPQLIEVELIEPSLFFESDPESADRFAAALEGIAQ